MNSASLAKTRPILALLLLAASAVCAAPATNSLVTLTATYEQAQKNIEDATEQQKSNVLTAYGQSLQTMMRVRKQAGDLDAYLVAEKESKRFQAHRTVLTNNLDILLIDPVLQYRKSIKAIEDDQNRQKAVLVRRYIERLDLLVKQCVMQDRIPEAKEARDTAEAARTLLADLAGAAPAPATVTPPAPPEAVASTTPTPKVAAPRQLDILKATWGAPGERPADVTKKIQDRVADGKLSLDDLKFLEDLPEGYTFFGSYYTERLKSKVLMIQYRYHNGLLKTVRKHGGESVQITD